MMDRFGPRAVMELGVALMGAGLLLAPLTTQPWHLYLTIGVLVGAGSVCLGYSGQSLFLPNWFIRRRGLAIGLAFAGVGIGSVTLLPWVQHMIEQTGWRTACTAMGILVLVVLAPINLLLRKRPEDIGLLPDGDAAPSATSAAPRSNVVDPVWASTDWTLRRALRTARFWWISLGYFCGLYIWYAVQVHQTKFLLDIGFTANVAVWALGVVSLLGIPGQIWLGHLSDRIGREWIWAISCLGFAICFRRADRAEIRAGVAAGLSHDLHPGRARLRPDLGDGRGGAGNFSGQAIWQHFWHHHAGGAGRRRSGPVGDRAAVRSFRQLHLSLCDRHRRQPPVGDRDLAGVATQGEGSRGTNAQGACPERCVLGRVLLCVIIPRLAGDGSI